jgi:hypothetical protein
MKENYYSPDHNGPGINNLHFCPTEAFDDPSPLNNSLACVQQQQNGLSGASALYQSAAASEQDSNFALASNQYSDVVAQYPSSEEALWSTRGYLRSGLRDNVAPTSRHDSLLSVWNDSALPLPVREAARREAVWALVAGELFADARTELQGIVSESGDDSLWAVVTLETVNMLAQGNAPNKQGGTIDPLVLHQRVNDFHDRLQELMGRPTDSEIANRAELPKSVMVSSVYPNPFNSTVTIKFDLPEAMQVRLEVFNVLGQKVETLVNGTMEAGAQVRQWNAEAVSSGVYFYRLVAGKHVESRKMMLMK